MRASHKTLGLWVLLILMFWAIYQIISVDHPPSQMIRVADMLARAEDGDLLGLTIEVKDGVATFDATSRTDGRIVAYGVLDGDIVDQLDKTELNYRIVAQHQGAGFWQT